MEYTKKVQTAFAENIGADIFFTFLEQYSRWGKGDITDRERNILEMLFRGVSIKEISIRFDLTTERVRQLINKATHRLKKAMTDRIGVEKEDLDGQIENLRNEVEFLRRRNEELSLKLGEKMASGHSNVVVMTADKMWNSSVVEKLMKPIKDDSYILSTRCINCLYGLDVNTLEDLMKYTPNDLLRARSFGRKTFNELREYVESQGFSWPKNPNDKFVFPHFQ